MLSTYQVNREDVLSVSCVRWLCSVAYSLLTVGHLAWRGARDRARSDMAFVENMVCVNWRTYARNQIFYIRYYLVLWIAMACLSRDMRTVDVVRCSLAARHTTSSTNLRACFLRRRVWARAWARYATRLM
jgi:hypothetical protein